MQRLSTSIYHLEKHWEFDPFRSTGEGTKVSDDRLRPLLVELLNAVATQPIVHLATVNEASYEGYFVCINVPRDLIESGASQVARVVLTDQVSQQYFEVRIELIRQSKNGEFEHLTQREIDRVLQRLVVESWVVRDSQEPSDRTRMVDEFIGHNCRAHESWEVYWIIEDLIASELFSVVDVHFHPFEGVLSDQLMQQDGPPWPDFDAKFVGKTVARASIRAGSRERALERAKFAIDDALNILRVASLSHRLLHDVQRLQRRGLYYFIRRSGANPSRLLHGAERGFRPLGLELGAATLEVVRERISDLDAAIGATQFPAIREPILRAIHWIGTSISYDRFDDKVVALCIALECLLCSGESGEKAAKMTVRYLLAGYAIEESEFVVHPLDFYEIYKCRNKIVHGADREVCDANDAMNLRYVALDTLHRILTLVKLQPEITSLQRHYEHLNKEAALLEVHDFLIREAPEPSHATCKLAEKWLNQVG